MSATLSRKTKLTSVLPGVLTESRDEVSLLMFRIEEENRPVQGTLLIQENLSPRHCARAQRCR